MKQNGNNVSEENYIMIQIAQYTYLQIVIETFSDAYRVKKNKRKMYNRHRKDS